ncbi:repeat protein [Moumouvirus goulette]|uniref:Repeat protein n=1 Tax=Moumouvirus goulette TaxID=1247379 RepID=M1PHT0_9VIRU|nr:repeat protein [Moumouvirus goulette]AGF85648.1 repeat protein [Moumouvirus goulette]
MDYIEIVTIGTLSESKIKNICPVKKKLIDDFIIYDINFNDLNYDEKFYLLLECIKNKSFDHFIKFATIFNEINFSDEENLLLDTACKYEMFDIVKFLIGNGVSAYNNNNKAIKIATYYNKGTNIIQYLIDSGANPHTDEEYPLCISAQTNKISMFKFLLKFNCDINARNNYCLLASVNPYNSREFIDVLIEYGVNIHYDDEIVLKYAACNCDIYLVNKLLQHGADINFLTNECLLHVIKYGNYELIKLLVDNGVNFSQVNNEITKNNIEMRKNNLLIDQGVNHIILFNSLVEKIRTRR